MSQRRRKTVDLAAASGCIRSELLHGGSYRAFIRRHALSEAQIKVYDFVLEHQHSLLAVLDHGLYFIP